MKKTILIIFVLVSSICLVKSSIVYGNNANTIIKINKVDNKIIDCIINYIYNNPVETINISKQEKRTIQEIAQNALQIVKKEEDRIKLNYILSWIELLEKNKQNQYEYLVKSEHLINKKTDYELVKSIYLNLSMIYLDFFKDKDSAIKCNEKFLNIVNKRNSIDESHSTYRYLKDKYLKEELYENAQDIVLEWVNYMRKSQDREKLAEALNSAGLVFATTSVNMNISTEFFLEALDTVEQLGELNQQILIMINISLNYINQNNIEESIKYLKMIEENKFIKKLDPYTKSFVYLNLASNYSNIKDKYNLRKYINLTNESISYLKQEEREKFHIVLGLLRSDLFRFENEFRKSFNQLEICRKNYENINNVYLTNFNIDLWEGYARLYLGVNDLKNALYYFEKSLAIAKKENSVINILKIYKELSLIYKQTNDFEKSLVYSRKYIELSESIKMQENNEYNSMLLKKFELKDKERAIKELKLKEKSNKNKISILIIAILISIIMILYIIISKKKVDKLNKSLSELSLIDGLTNVSNRRALDKFFKSNWNEFIISQASISIIMIDIDYFKLYNDNYGHQAGDEVLSSVAQSIKNSCYLDNKLYEPKQHKLETLVARYGGEEFIVVLANKSKKDAIGIAEKIKKSVQDLNLTHEYSKVSNKVTLSMGISTESLNQNSKYLSIIEKADNALYYSKQNNRNTYTHIEDVI